VVEILSWDISDDIKTRLLGFTNEQLSIWNKGYSTTVNAYILKNNLDTDDLPHLFATFKRWDHELQQIIHGLAIDNVGLIITNPKNVSIKILKILFETNDLDYIQKIELFISSLPNLDKGICKECLDLLDLAEYNKIFESRYRPKFEINAINEKLLIAFKENNWIYDFQEDQDKERYYKIVRHRPTLKSLSSDLL
jgi:hypothetical protein